MSRVSAYELQVCIFHMYIISYKDYMESYIKYTILYGTCKYKSKSKLTTNYLLIKSIYFFLNFI